RRNNYREQTPENLVRMWVSSRLKTRATASKRSGLSEIAERRKPSGFVEFVCISLSCSAFHRTARAVPLPRVSAMGRQPRSCRKSPAASAVPLKVSAIGLTPPGSRRVVGNVEDANGY
ncbi:MAG: hypothetical protein NTZ32_19875, partial [Planctomycetales bacterium]|nr:hypothetical protein [Planctomycetales bacterium]